MFLTPILYLGGRIILARDFDPAASLRWITEEGCTVILGVPTLLQVWMNSPYFTRAAAINMAKEAGLDMADDSHDSLLFWKSLGTAPMHEGVTLKEQVDYMVSQVKAKKGKVAAART